MVFKALARKTLLFIANSAPLSAHIMCSFPGNVTVSCHMGHPQDQRMETTKVSDYDRIMQIRNDPQYDGTILGANGCVDREQRKIVAICELSKKLFRKRRGLKSTLIAHFALRGIPPAVAGRMTLAEIETQLSAEVNQREQASLEESNGTEPTAQVSIKAERSSRTERQAEWLAKAMLLVRDHPEWSNAEIARSVQIHPSGLSRSQPFRTAAGMARSGAKEPPRGHYVRNRKTGRLDIEAVCHRSTEVDDKSDRGQQIPGSPLFREYCSECDEPMRVGPEKVGKNPRC